MITLGKEKKMRNIETFMMVLVSLIFIGIQCTKNPVESQSVTDLSNDDPFIQITTLANEIVELDESALTDSSTNAIPRRLHMALEKLDDMLNQVRIVVMASEIDDATMLYQEARVAQQRAIDAARDGHYKKVFGFIRESQFLAQEAIRLIKGEMTPDEIKEAVLQHLIEKKEHVQILLNEVDTLLEELENNYAQRLYERAALHFEIAEEALSSKELRRAHFHLEKAEEYSQRALKILNQSE